jgi:hypothetical protein
MAVNYHQPSVIALFEAMPVPLLTFGVSGKVTYANKAAKLHPGRPVESMDDKQVIKSLVADAVLAKIKLPYPMEIELAEGHRMKGQFMAGPAGLDVAFMADGEGLDNARPSAESGRMGLKDTIGFLREEVGPPLKRFIIELRAQPVSDSAKALDAAAKALHERLSRLADLIDVFGEDVAFADDRLEIVPMVRALCAELAPRAQGMKINFQVLDTEQTLPPIYGSEKLLRRAFYECMDNALVHSRKEMESDQTSTVEIRFKMTGTHVLVGIHNRGATRLKVGSADALKPFARTTSASAPTEPLTKLGLPLVQRIVALHGGSMRMNTTGDDTVNMLLEFPTGAPQRGQNQLDIAQAQRYANDFAQLMSRRKKEKK